MVHSELRWVTGGDSARDSERRSRGVGGRKSAEPKGQMYRGLETVSSNRRRRRMGWCGGGGGGSS